MDFFSLCWALFAIEADIQKFYRPVLSAINIELI